MGRNPCCSKEGLNKGAWTAQEDEILRDYIKVHGEGRWRDVPRKAGLKRCGKSCRLRWLNYLRPDIKRGNISDDEEELIIRLHKLLGNRWSLIAGRLPGRTDNEIKNYWNTKIGKKPQEKQSKNEKKPMIKSQPHNDAPPESGVIQDNALQCTKFLDTPEQQNLENLDNKVAVGPCFDGNSGDISSISFASGDDNSSGIMIDFNMGEISFPEITDSDFTKLNAFDITDFNNAIESDGTNNGCKSKLLYQPLSLSGETVNNWNGSECAQADMASDFQFLTSCLGSSGEWLGEDLDVFYSSCDV